jgi:hypothetical protein
MRIVSGKEYYSPKEIAQMGLITNSKGKPDYGFVLRLVKRGELEAVVFNELSNIPYYLISKEAVEKYSKRFNQSK